MLSRNTGASKSGFSRPVITWQRAAWRPSRAASLIYTTGGLGPVCNDPAFSPPCRTTALTHSPNLASLTNERWCERLGCCSACPLVGWG